MRISILIPTFNRPGYLRACLQSCLDQTIAPWEILIGDDSANAETESLISAFVARSRSATISYFHHQPALGQDANVASLMRAATGSHLLLIHDDDWLIPTALEDLSVPFKHPEVVVSYGRQVQASNDGIVDWKNMMSFNKAYFRGPGDLGLQDNILESVLCGQFPNNGWLVAKQAAERVDYHDSKKEFGDGCDFRFSVLFAEANPGGKAFLVENVTAVYRLSAMSIERGGRSTAAMRIFPYLLRQKPSVLASARVEHYVRAFSKPAIGQAIAHGQLEKAWEWYWSCWHRPFILTPGGIKRGLKLFRAILRARWRDVLPG